MTRLGQQFWTYCRESHEKVQNEPPGMTILDMESEIQIKSSKTDNQKKTCSSIFPFTPKA